jgi:rare lipoprotein A
LKANRLPLFIAALLAALASAAGAGENGPSDRGTTAVKSETGLASWYGYPYHGRTAAGGEIYDMEKLTAAHRTLPFGTRIQVKNLRNGRSVEVEITDRGPFTKDRILDVSYAAARTLGMVDSGLARVQLQPAASEQPSDEGFFGVQAGAFRIRSNADRYQSKMEKLYGAARILPQQGRITLWRVVVGREPSIPSANSLSARLMSENPDVNGATFVVRLD